LEFQKSNTQVIAIGVVYWMMCIDEIDSFMQRGFKKRDVIQSDFETFLVI